jgi:hypothetical protein
MKHYTVAAKKKAKKAKSGMPQLAPSKKRTPSGQLSRAGKDTDPAKTAREARARRFGGTGCQEGKKALTGQHMEHELGFVLEAECKPDEISALWRVWCSLEAAIEGYRRRYIGQTGRPKGASLEMASERFEVDQSAPVDLRSDADKDRAAVASWMRWKGFLWQIEPDLREALEIARETPTALWGDYRPTAKGKRALAALRALRLVVG